MSLMGVDNISGHGACGLFYSLLTDLGRCKPMLMLSGVGQVGVYYTSTGMQAPGETCN